MTSLTFDTDRDVQPGDVLYTRAGSHYLILTVRQVQRRDPTARRRLNLTVDRLPPNTDPDPGVPHHLILWYRRDRKHPST